MRTIRRTIALLASAALGATGLAVASGGPAAAAPVSVTFTYTGAPQEWIVPAGVTAISVDAYGAQGGRGYGENYLTTLSAESDPGALGGRAMTTIAVTPGESVQVNVGGRGSNGSTSAFRASLGGYNGGGDGGYVSIVSGLLVAGGGGGGSSDVRTGGTTVGDRVVVAAGGGGSGGGQTAVRFSDRQGTPVVTGGPGGDGGGSTGESSAPVEYAAGGGTPSAGGAKGPTYVAVAPSSDSTDGAFAQGGAGGEAVDEFFGYTFASAGGGGGGGLWGGGGGGANGFDGSAGGGGGSSLGLATTPGVRQGNGLVIITYVQATVPGAPQNVATPSDGRAAISFAPPVDDGGNPITGYTATCGAQSATGASSPLVVTGLTNGVTVQCAVTATNAVGTGPPSAPVDVTPALPQLRVQNVTTLEGNDGTSVVLVPVTLSAPAPQLVTVGWSTANGGAVAPGDYAADAGTLRFPAGITQARIPVTIKGDVLDEGDESFRIQLSNPVGATIARGLASVTLQDDDPPPVIVPQGVTVAEGNSSTKTVQLAVRLSAPSGRKVTASWLTMNDSAVTPADYVAASGTVVFAPGQTQRTVAVTVRGDTVREANERFFVAFSNPKNAVIGGIYGLGFVTITNDD